MAKKTTTIKIKDGKIHPMNNGAITSPCLIFRGDKPSVGDCLEFTLENGVTYSGTVRDVTSADGEVLAEFENGIQPK